MASISNIFIDQGANFSTTLTINDSTGSALDLTNYTAIAQIRKSPSSSTSVSFTAAFVDPRTSGKITLTLTDTQTTALEAGRFVYDVVITAADGTKTRVVEGQVTVNPSVTR